jgi:hypothetical protein
VKRLSVAAIVLLVLGLSSPANAALLRLTPDGVPYGSYTGPTDPAIIDTDGFRLTFNGTGNQSLVDPVMIILGIPGTSAASTPAPTFTSTAPTTIQAGGTNVYGGTWNTSTGFAGIYDATTSQSGTSKPLNVYEYIGFKPSGSASENYTNWSSKGDTSWVLYAYTMTFPTMQQGEFADFLGTLPVGTFVIGYGCEALKAGACSNPGSTESTPFTFAGYVVPEPSSLVLLSLGLAVVGGARGRRKTLKKS